MKILYLAVNGTSVFGTSLHSGVDAVNAANEWWDGENETRGDIDDIIELDIPDSADIEDFNDCTDILEYERRADIMNGEQKCERCAKLIKDNEKIIDSQGDVYCEKCVLELIKRGIYCSVEDFQGFND